MAYINEDNETLMAFYELVENKIISLMDIPYDYRNAIIIELTK